MKKRSVYRLGVLAFAWFATACVGGDELEADGAGISSLAVAVSADDGGKIAVWTSDRTVMVTSDQVEGSRIYFWHDDPHSAGSSYDVLEAGEAFGMMLRLMGVTVDENARLAAVLYNFWENDGATPEAAEILRTKLVRWLSLDGVEAVKGYFRTHGMTTTHAVEKTR